MNDNNLKEQYDILRREELRDKKKTILIISLCAVVVVVTFLGIWFSYKKTDVCTLNCDTNGDGKADTNIDLDNDNICDVNCIVVGKDNKEYMINVDYNGDRKPHFNLDTDNDKIPDTNLINKDTNGDNVCDFNCDTNKDGKPDTNIDFDNDNVCDLNCKWTDDEGNEIITNIDKDNDNICDLNCDTDNDGVCNYNCDKDNNGECDWNCFDKKDDVCILNCDVNNDNVCDLNCDTNNDGKADKNLDNDKDGVCDLNCDTNNDNVCDLNCDTNNDGKADKNLDNDKDGVCDLNCDTNNDNICDLNCDTNNDGKADKNLDTNGDGKCDLDCDTNNDGKCDYNCDINNNGVCDDPGCESVERINATLKSLSVGGYELVPSFKETTTNYTITITDNISSVDIKAIASNSKAKISGTGVVKLNATETKVKIIVTAVAGNTKVYNLTIIKKVDSGDTEFEAPDGVLLTLVSYKSIEAKDIFPGWTGTQEFTIKNETSRTLVYKINLLVDKNDFVSDNFKYSLVKNGVEIIKQKTAPKSNVTVIKDLVIAPGDTAKFEVRYAFVDTGSEQNIDQGRNYSARTEVDVTAMSSSLVK